MKQLLFSLSILLVTISCHGQKDQKFNLDFEQHNEGANLAEDWFQWGDHKLSIDTLAYSGKKAGKVTSLEGGNFGSIAYKIPAKYEGKSIKLEGYM